ncbi:MAG: galactokinase, partial [Nitrospiraceae bacterium]|nr:galactokinase [Nitrospiraceae bacterium]
MDRSFYDLFGREPYATAQAPGRVNLIGEHTDYNGGYVLPMAIPQQTRVQLALRPDHTVRAWSANVEPATAVTEDRLGSETQERRWVDYIQGITAIARQERLDLRGFDLRVESDVPQGAGLSSSAALQISLLRALRRVFSWNVDDVGLARLGQRAENEFVGAPVGIMDQMACSLADESHVLFLDTRTRAYERIPFPDATGLIVIDSGVAHSHAAGDYRTRRAECDRAAALLEVDQLR